jgi:hypothetical protein
MRALTIRQPWAGAFFADRLPKDIENRSFATTYRGTLLIHAGAQLAAEPTVQGIVEQRIGKVPWLGAHSSGVAWQMGAIIGAVDLVSIHPIEECGGLCSSWALPARAHWRVANPRLLRRPVQALGKLGLWTPDEDLAEAVQRVGLVKP